MTDKKSQDEQTPRDKGRRRLLRLALYAPPTIIGLSSFVGRAYAQGPTVSVGTASNADSKAVVNPK